jgi:hypothetical protein
VEVKDADDVMPSDAQVQAAAEGRPTHPGEPHSGGTMGRLNWLRAGVLGSELGQEKRELADTPRPSWLN